MLSSNSNVFVTKQQNLVIELSIFLFLQFFHVLVCTCAKRQKLRKKKFDLIDIELVLLNLGLLLFALLWLMLILIILVLILFYVVFCLVYVFFPLLFLDLFSQSINRPLASVLLKTIHPCISHPFAMIEYKKPILIDLAHLLLFSHVKRLNLVSEILNLLFYIPCRLFFAIGIYCFFEIFFE